MKKNLDEERENDINCTFKPQLFSNNNQFNNKLDKDTNVIDRNKLWLDQKESKLNKIRKNDENKDLEQCTFQPLTTVFLIILSVKMLNLIINRQMVLIET